MINKAEKLPRYEVALYVGACVLLVGPLALFLLNEPEIDQFRSAIDMGLKYAMLPFAILFAAFFNKKKIEAKRKVFLVLNFAVIYTVCTVCPLLLVNMYVGTQEDLTISGSVVEKTAGWGTHKASVTIRTATQKISLRLPESDWNAIALDQEVTIDAKIGSLKLIYK
jgi:hypothetical protein